MKLSGPEFLFVERLYIYIYVCIYIYIIYSFLVVLGFHCCMDFSLFAVSGCCSPVAVL